MKVNQILYWLLIVLLSVGLFGAGNLVWNEIQTGNGCPKIFSVPACVIIFFCFLIPLITHVLKKWLSFYFIFTGLGLIIATIASFMQFLGIGECPKTGDNIPMCYLSFLIFSTLVSIKIILSNKNTK